MIVIKMLQPGGIVVEKLNKVPNKIEYSLKYLIKLTYSIASTNGMEIFK